MSDLGCKQSDWVHNDSDTVYLIKSPGLFSDTQKNFFSTGDTITFCRDGLIKIKSASLFQGEMSGGMAQGTGKASFLTLNNVTKLTLYADVINKTRPDEVYNHGIANYIMEFGEIVIWEGNIIGSKHVLIRRHDLEYNPVIIEDVSFLEQSFEHYPETESVAKLRAVFESAVAEKCPDLSISKNHDDEYEDDVIKKSWGIINFLSDNGLVQIT
ncbi:hypothetical protein [Enterobacter cloacae]